MRRARSAFAVLLTSLPALCACGVVPDQRSAEPSVLPVVERPQTPGSVPSAQGSAPATPGGASATVTAAPSGSPTPTGTPSSAPEPTSASSAPPSAGPSPSPSQPSDTPTSPSERELIEAEVVELTNAERADAGCSAVHADERLVTAARSHSEDMVERDFFDHTNPDGDGPGDRARAAGYDWRAVSENIAWGQRTAEAVVAGWMDSAGHRRNILDCDMVAVGIGVADSDRGPYWTQVFGRR